MGEAVDLYLRVRQKEGRLYTDQIVGQLPTVPMDHPLRSEWQARAASSDRLARHLTRLQHPVSVLDIGCGNGWMASKMARAVDGPVVGLDRYGAELLQARRVFGGRPHLNWIAADLSCAPFFGRLFNAIVVASAIQYFSDLNRLIQVLLPLLAPAGEIHILDSPLYAPEDLAAARQRSKNYYKNLGLPEMANHYYHHCLDSLNAYDPVWLYTPGFRRTDPANPMTDSPFPWVCLRPGQ